jgi:hypothetical protein
MLPRPIGKANQEPDYSNEGERTRELPGNPLPVDALHYAEKVLVKTRIS